MIPKSQHAKAIPLQLRRAISMVPPPHIMLAAIQLDNQFLLEADEINGVCSDRRLPAKLPAAELAKANALPQMPLGIGHFVA